jgi:hypothetical protein
MKRLSLQTRQLSNYRNKHHHMVHRYISSTILAYSLNIYLCIYEGEHLILFRYTYIYDFIYMPLYHNHGNTVMII